MMEFPSSRENPISTHGRKGAWKFKRPKKFMRTFGFLLLQIYTNMMVKAWPKNTRFTNMPNICTTIKKITMYLSKYNTMFMFRSLEIRESHNLVVPNTYGILDVYLTSFYCCFYMIFHMILLNVKLGQTDYLSLFCFYICLHIKVRVRENSFCFLHSTHLQPLYI